MGGLCECITKELRKGLIDYVLRINSCVMKPSYHTIQGCARFEKFIATMNEKVRKITHFVPICRLLVIYIHFSNLI